jgi:hypothetical protein
MTVKQAWHVPEPIPEPQAPVGDLLSALSAWGADC